MKQWYEIIAKSESKTEIWIYDEIGENYWSEDGGITAKSFQKDLSAINTKSIDLHINSPGGNVWDGVTIYNLLKNHPAAVTTYVDGLAASIATVIALAGDKVVMAKNGLWMIHNPSGMVIGNATQMREFADVLDKVGGTMLTTYKEKVKKDESEIRAKMEAETYMTADEALEYGFVDEIAGEMRMAACAKFAPILAKMGCRNIPETLTGMKEKPKVRQIEDALRDLGFSKKEAMSILSKGYSEPTGDPVGETESPKPVLSDSGPVRPAKKDKVSDLLTRAELIAPSIN